MRITWKKHIHSVHNDLSRETLIGDKTQQNFFSLDSSTKYNVNTMKS